MSERNTFTPEQETWLKALESGEYAQGRERLRTDINGQSAFCCLGVACEIGLAEPDVDGFYLWGDKLHLHTKRGNFPEAVEIDGYRYGGLATMNDKGMTFAQIAAFIRANPWQVFTNFDVPEPQP